MTNIDHDRVVRGIQDLLGGEPVSRSFKLPFGSAKIILHGLERRQHFTEVVDEPEEVDDAEVRGIREDQKTDPNRPILDWGSHWNRGREASCIHCGKPTLLLDDAGRPAHKVCVEAALAPLAEQAA